MYDFINILCGLNVITKSGRNCCYWLGLKVLTNSIDEISQNQSNLLHNTSFFCFLKFII